MHDEPAIGEAWVVVHHQFAACALAHIQLDRVGSLLASQQKRRNRVATRCF